VDEYARLDTNVERLPIFVNAGAKLTGSAGFPLIVMIANTVCEKTGDDRRWAGTEIPFCHPEPVEEPALSLSKGSQSRAETEIPRQARDDRGVLGMTEGCSG